MSRSASPRAKSRAAFGTARGVITGVYETAEGVVKVVLSPRESLARAKEIFEFAKDHPKEFLAGLTKEGKAAYYALKSDYNKLLYAEQADDRTSLFSASDQFFGKVGPFLVGVGVGGFALKGSRIINVIGDIVRTGKAPNIDIPKPNIPDLKPKPNVDGPNRPDAVPPKQILVPEDRFPESAAHIRDAQAAGQPSVVTINRPGAKDNRRDSLRGKPTQPDTTDAHTHSCQPSQSPQPYAIGCDQ